MEVASALEKPNILMDIKWSPMMMVSVLFHLGVFMAILFIPDSFSTRKQFNGPVYEVSLVEMPAAGPKKTTGITSSSKAPKAALKVSKSAKRIPATKKAPAKKVIAQRTAARPSTKPKETKVDSSQQIAEAIKKLETKYESQDINRHLLEAINKIKAGAEESDTGGASQGGSTTIGNLQIRLYQIEVESWVKSKWAYPTAARNSRALEAVVVLKVEKSGRIQESWFEKYSNDTVFDQSVLKAVERSNPLPPFPESYRKSYDEIEIIFNLKDIE